MSLRKRWLPSRRWLIVPPVVLGILVVGMLARSKKQLPTAEPNEQAIAVEVVAMERQSIRPAVTGYGTSRPKNIWTAVAEVGGRVVEIHPRLRSGNRIEQGEILLQIDPADYRLRIEQREADLSQAEAQLEQLAAGYRVDKESLTLQQSLLEVRRTEVNRLRELRGNAAASQSESDTAQASFLQQALAVQNLERTIALSPAQMKAAQAAIVFASARLDEAKRELQRTTIQSPFRGLLTDVELQPQQYVAPGAKLFELHDTDTVEVEAQFSLSQLSRLLTVGDAQDTTELATLSGLGHVSPNGLLSGLAATVTVRSGDVAIEFEGHPVRTSGTFDEQTRTIGVVVEVNSDGQLDARRSVALRSGAYCEVVLSRQSDVLEWVVPRTALRSGAVYLVDDSNRLVRRQVRTKATLGRDLAVDGLAAGDRLVIQPPTDFAVGMLVDPQIQNAKPAGDGQVIGKVVQP